ncbi:MAG: hypothetical protein ACI8RD_014888, partial [Bacillariaceae sp.]
QFVPLFCIESSESSQNYTHSIHVYIRHTIYFVRDVAVAFFFFCVSPITFSAHKTLHIINHSHVESLIQKIDATAEDSYRRHYSSMKTRTYQRE